VTPRIGTISPWSSKATDIAWNCGLEAVERIERGIAFCARMPAKAFSARAGADRRLLHDRMTETVLGRFRADAELFRHFRRSRCLRRPAGGGAPRWSKPTAAGLALSDDEIDYLVDLFVARRSAIRPTSS
jgi:phosphoribosylformylglycinamidine synthase